MVILIIGHEIIYRITNPQSNVKNTFRYSENKYFSGLLIREFHSDYLFGINQGVKKLFLNKESVIFQDYCFVLLRF